MRVLIADKLPDRSRVRLASGGMEVYAEPDLHGDALVARLAELDPTVLIVRSTKVRKAELEAARSLGLVVRAGAGVNNVDLDFASAKGVFVSNCPGKNAVAVAELAMGLMLALDRHIADGVVALRAGRWDKKRFSKARGLKDRTLGIIGCGSIGEEVIKRARAFGMEVLVWSRSMTPERAEALGAKSYETPEEVALRSEFLSVHLALTPETRGFVGESIFSVMKPGAVFVNTARAEVVDQEALIRHMDAKGLRAGLDVFDGEPASSAGPFTDPIGSHPNVYGSHHIGASTDQAQEAVADEACRVVEAWLATGSAPNCVNLASRSKATHTLVVRHADKVGVLAAVLEELRKAELNVEEMENRIFAGGGAAIASIRVSGDPTQSMIDALTAQPTIFAVSVVTLS